MDFAVEENEYRWLEAAKFYEKQLHTTTYENLAASEYLERIGFCYSLASRQVRSLNEFRKVMGQAISAYESAGTLLSKGTTLEKQGISNENFAKAEYSRYLNAFNLDERTRSLDKCHELCKKAIDIFRKTGDEIHLGKTSNILSLCLLDRLEFSPTFEEKKLLIQECADNASTAITALSKTTDDDELLLALSLAGISWWTIGIAFGDREESSKKALNYTKQASRLYRKSSNPYTKAKAMEAATWSTLYFSKRIEDAWKFASEIRKQASIAKDNHLKGISYFLLSHVIDLKFTLETDQDKRRHNCKETIKYAKKSIQYCNLSNNGLIESAAYFLCVEGYNSLARDFPITTTEKLALLKKAIEIGEKGRKHAVKFGSPDYLTRVLHALSKTFQYYSKIEPRKAVKRRLLNEAKNYRIQVLTLTEKILPANCWNIGADRVYAAQIKADLARLEDNKTTKQTQMQEAVAEMKFGVSICANWSESGNASWTKAIAADYEDYLGRMLNEYYLLVKDKEILAEANKYYKNAAEKYKVVDLPSRVAECYWRTAQNLDLTENYQEASEKFAKAFEAYKATAMKIRQFTKFYLAYATYMKAWSQIEQAKNAHSIEDYNTSKYHYEKAARLHASSKPWSYLAMNYRAWASMEEAEGFSRKENTQRAKQTFQKALQQFAEAESSIKQKIGEIAHIEEKELLHRLLKAADLRRGYCQARIQIEEAKLLDRKSKYLQSSKIYREASQKLASIIEKTGSEAERKELELLATFCQAWEKLAIAEETTSSESYLEAAKLFEYAKDNCYTNKASLWALGNSNFCRGLAAGVEYQKMLDVEEHNRAKGYIQNAATNYFKAGYRNASEYAKATLRLFDAYLFMNQAERESDTEKRVKQYQLAENLLQLASGSFMEAQQPEKTAQVKQILENVREEKELAISFNEVLQAPSIASTTQSFIAPSPTSEVSVGLEQFQNANIQANLIAGMKEAKVGESFCLTVEFINVGKESALLTRIEDFIPSEFKVVKKPEIYRLEESCLNMKGKQIEPLKLVEAKLVLQPSKKGVYHISPTVHYLDELGQNNSLQLKSVEIKVEEVILANRVPTGTKELDSLLLGGIPKDYAVVLTGAPSDERELIIKNFLESGTREGQTSFYATTEALGLENLLEKSGFYLFLCNPKPKVEVSDLPNFTKLRSKTDINNLNMALARESRNLLENRSIKRVCIEIVSDVLLRLGPEVTRRWLSELITELGSKGFTFLAVMNPGMHPPDQATAVIDLFDGEISITQSDDSLECKKSVQVKKLRGQDYIKNSICLTKS